MRIPNFLLNSAGKPEVNEVFPGWLKPGDQFVRGLILHFKDGEPFLPQILDGCSYMIYSIVDDKEPVMGFAECLYGDWRVLRIVLGDIQGKLLRYFLGIDESGHPVCAFVSKRAALITAFVTI